MEEKNTKKFLLDDAVYETMLTSKFLKRKPYKAPDKRIIYAFIPGVIEKLHIHQGSKVKEGDKLLVLEAMKMKNDVTAPFSGTVKILSVREGSRVAKGELLLEIE